MDNMQWHNEDTWILILIIAVALLINIEKVIK